ncbi:MAG: protein-L-isoaspartate(D-aspartate) O-methyltransferase [Clostridia bacterium]|nr:protein-L-isoaspartate(D-aspartate) O-methyltransferase [Clostridia bacterium]
MKDKMLFEFFKELDRSFFIDNVNKVYAAQDRPLPIGYGQRISQPSLVLEMTQFLELDKNLRVLEIGTGSGYQTAFLAQFSKEVYTIELIKALSDKARKRLDSLGYGNIRYKVGDGSEGWDEFAPYDRIMVTAAAGFMPDRLIRQLAVTGRMIAPVGPRGCQDLYIITKGEDGKERAESVGKVTFVEMKGRYGW